MKRIKVKHNTYRQR